MFQHSIGFDFGTESVRVVAVETRTGHLAAQVVQSYSHGVINRALPTSREPLPPDYALQHPQDWLEAGGRASREAVRASNIASDEVVGIGVAFTSCTMLPCLDDGTPLCLIDRFKRVPHAWPKLWKHHGAKAETDRINAVARQRNEPWLARYGGTIGIEWFFPKILEILNHAPDVYDAADVFIEAGDWLVWQLIDGPFPHCRREAIVRSTCQAGYKAMWNAKTGYPSREYFEAVHPKLVDVAQTKLPGVHRSPGRESGVLTDRAAALLHLRPGTPVSTAVIDAHAGVPGAGVASPSTLVMVLGTSACHMMNSRIEATAPGIAGVVEDGILPGYFGYEMGQASVGDALAWCARTLDLAHDELSRRAAALAPGSGGVMAIDWLNGCRSPLMDGRLSGAFLGLTLGTTPEQMYRAMIEATAFGLRWVCDTLRGAGVPVRRFVATGGLASRSPLLLQIYADVLDARIRPAASDQAVALGAAILGCLAAGAERTGHASMSQVIHAMAPEREDAPLYRPDLAARRAYEKLYEIYRSLVRDPGQFIDAMRRLRASVPSPGTPQRVS